MLTKPKSKNLVFEGLIDILCLRDSGVEKIDSETQWVRRRKNQLKSNVFVSLS